MAQIAEELYLLLLDNASAQPALDRQRRARVVAAAALLDLAYACLIRPAVAGDPVEAGLLVALTAAAPVDPVGAPALRLLQRRPMRPTAVVAKLRKHTEHDLTRHLERTGQIRRVGLRTAAVGGAVDGRDHLAAARRRRSRCAAEPQRARLALGARPRR